MKVCLVNPTDQQLMFAELPSFMRHADKTSRMPPLGLLYIAAYLLDRTSHDVTILDAALEDLSYDAIEDRLRALGPDVVGITTYTLSLLDTLEIARRAKRANPNALVVLGGPHVALYPAETAMLSEVDVAVPGEGEAVMAELVDALAQHRPLDGVPGLYFRRNGELGRTAARDPIANLDSLPFPARHLLPRDAYRFVSDRSASSTSMVSSRGCPFKCIFCDIPFHFTRVRSPENIARELVACAEMGYGEVNFYDDTFNLDDDRVAAMCREMIRCGTPVQFSIRTRAGHTKAETIDLLYRAGCRRMSFGIEAGDDETLRYLKKGITVEMAREAVRLAKDRGIEVATYFIVAIPGRPYEDSLRTIDFAIELDPQYAQFIYMGLLPGTRLYADALKAGAFDRDVFLDFARAPAATDIRAYWPNPLSWEEARAVTRLAYRRFYLRPAYIWKMMKRVHSLHEVARKGRAALDVFSYAVRHQPVFQPSGRSR
jgi:anaerobic magnesium-protoporphyrin IX monomethyl ester cyclase